MRGTESLNIVSNKEIEMRLTNEARHHSPDTLTEMAVRSRVRMSEYTLATFEEVTGPKINVQDQLKQQEASERFLSGQSIKWLDDETNTNRIFHGIYFTTEPLLD